jgi:hypothetical protein
MDKRKEKEIQLMAYYNWLEDNCRDEHTLNNWLEAEKEWPENINKRLLY